MLQENSLGRAKTGSGAFVDFTGPWKNELGSEMTLVQVDDKLTGKYVSTVSSFNTTTEGALEGYVKGDLIAFVVRWESFQAITSWVGQLVPNVPEETIKTLWQMTKQVDAGEEWASINAGADLFKRAT